MERCPKRLQETCPRRLNGRGCEVVMHHLFHPRRKFEQHSELAAEFRDLKINQVPMCQQQETELHQAQPEGTPIPTSEVMRHVVDNERQRRDLAVRQLRRP